MLKYLVPVLALTTAAASGQNLQTGRWDVTSKVVVFAVPGIPGFVARMITGKSRAEHKRLGAGDGIQALLAPDPKARCQVGDQRIADGRYTQTLTCPRKNGTPLKIARVGTYDGTGFIGRATVSGTTPKGNLRILLDQRAARVGS